MDSILAQQVSNAFDFSQFQILKAKARKADDKTLRAVAQQFESIFIKMALDSMRKASKELESDLFKSSYQDFYQDLYDDQLSVNLAENGGIGLTDALVRYLSQQVSPEQVLNVNRQLKKEDNQDSQTAFKQLLTTLKPYLDGLSEELGVSQKAILAHAIVETGWGSSNLQLGKHKVNLFGKFDKFHSDKKGEFKSIQNSIEVYKNFLKDKISSNKLIDNKEKLSEKDFFKLIQLTLYPKEPEKLQQLLNVSESSMLKENNF